jgi:hypothetical protein
MAPTAEAVGFERKFVAIPPTTEVVGFLAKRNHEMFNRGDILILLIVLKWTAVMTILLLLGLLPIFFKVMPLMLLFAVGFAWIGMARELRKRWGSS